MTTCLSNMERSQKCTHCAKMLTEPKKVELDLKGNSI